MNYSRGRFISGYDQLPAQFEALLLDLNISQTTYHLFEMQALFPG